MFDTTERRRYSVGVIRLIEFDWDQWNVQKNEIKHGVSRLEAESVFHDSRYKLYADIKHFVAAGSALHSLWDKPREPSPHDRIHHPRRQSPRYHGSPGVTKGTAHL